MASILTNTSAMAALATLRSVSSNLSENQSQVSSGLRVESAADNAAYWSIATTMRSDEKAVAAVSDALGLAQAKIETFYAGMDSAIDVMSEFKAKLVAAKEDGVDKAKIQTELEQLKSQLVSISQSSSFSGQNWFTTSIADIYDTAKNDTAFMSSFVRYEDGSVGVTSSRVDLSSISLFNSTGGGILQQDGRSPGAIGGLRNADVYSIGNNAWQSGFKFTGPLIFADDTTAITFDMTVDADDPSTTPSPNPGTTVSVTINRSLVDSVFPTLNGVISNRDQFVRVLQEALVPHGAIPAGHSVLTPDEYSIGTSETSGKPGSSMYLTNVASTLADGSTGGLFDSTSPNYGPRPAVVTDWEGPFRIVRTVVIHVPITVNDVTKTLVIDKDMVDSTLGTTTGEVTSAGDLAAVLNAAITAQGVGVKVTSTGSGLKFEADGAVHPEAGSKASIEVGPATDNLGDVAIFNILDLDITSDAIGLDTYISGVDSMLQKMAAAGSTLGALQARVGIQSEFTERLQDSITSGVGKLVDTDMEEASARLAALQTQQQLAISSLGIANSAPQNLLQLFR
ncbi:MULTISPECIES: flagellin [unclassified Sinorhizobium]|uniref:flagellin N-terminal helical domain-containing protein n=1 Tax=unclassified Sinorhizobium TaxID=2613772 RepID=UPI0035257638